MDLLFEVDGTQLLRSELNVGIYKWFGQSFSEWFVHRLFSSSGCDDGLISNDYYEVRRLHNYRSTNKSTYFGLNLLMRRVFIQMIVSHQRRCVANALCVGLFVMILFIWSQTIKSPFNKVHMENTFDMNKLLDAVKQIVIDWVPRRGVDRSWSKAFSVEHASMFGLERRKKTWLESTLMVCRQKMSHLMGSALEIHTWAAESAERLVVELNE